VTVHPILRPLRARQLRLAAMMTERQLTAIARARLTSAQIVEIIARPMRRRSHTAAELHELRQGDWAERERERLVCTWGQSG
jgi:hypothetical protein